MKFVPSPGQAQQILLPTSLAALALGALLIWIAVTAPVGFGTFLLLVLALATLVLGLLVLAYAISFQALSYYLDRNGVVIRAGVCSISLPMQAIDGVYSISAEELGGRFRGLRLPGHSVGHQRTAGGADVVFVATSTPEDCLYVKAGSTVYAISPAEPELFRRTYEIERTLGSLRPLPQGLQLPVLLQNLHWRDRLGRTLAAIAVVACLALVALAFWRYPGLPAEVAMHFNAQGLPDRMAPPSGIFYLPVVGLVVLTVNTALGAWIYRRERVLSYFLWGGAALVQILLIMALHTITG